MQNAATLPKTNVGDLHRVLSLAQAAKSETIVCDLSKNFVQPSGVESRKDVVVSSSAAGSPPAVGEAPKLPLKILRNSQQSTPPVRLR